MDLLLPMPSNITETTDFFEGDSVYFRMGDKGENVTMRVSIDLDGDGVFNQSNDVFSNWLNFSCELNENGTELLDENCSISFTYQFSANNSTIFSSVLISTSIPFILASKL